MSNKRDFNEIMEVVATKIITAPDVRTIMVFLNTSGLLNRIMRTLFEVSKEEYVGVGNWGEFRIVTGCSLKELQGYQDQYGTDYTTAFAENFPELLEKSEAIQIAKTPTDTSRDIVALVTDLMIDDDKYENLISTLSKLYGLSREEVESLPFEAFTTIFETLQSTGTFTVA